jgi:hypothetical protein
MTTPPDGLVFIMECLSCAKTMISKKGMFYTYNWCDTCFYYEVVKHTGCCHSPNMQYVRFKQINDTYVLRMQCFTCYQLNGKAFKKTEVSNFDSLIEAMPEMTMNERWQEKDRFIKFINENKYRISQNNYSIYLSSDEWKAKRKEVLKRDSYICQGCLTENATEVHHTTYSNIGNELYYQLVSLCSDCHERVHNPKTL